MPFYLVTYTALVEAEDEVGAAEKVMANLQIEPRMTFTVKLDENSIKHVSLTRQMSAVEEMVTERHPIHQDLGHSADVSGSRSVQNDKPAIDATAKPSGSAGMFGAIFLALSLFVLGLVGLFHFISFPGFR